MKKWHKILGIVLLSILFIVGIFWQWIIYYESRALRVTFAAHDCKDILYIIMSGDAILFGITYNAALFLFICRCKKVGNNHTREYR